VSGRDYHALHHENPAFRFDAEVSGARVVFRPYLGVPAIVARSNGAYGHQPDWYRAFLYAEERARGLDDVEDLASPGVFRWDLAGGEAVLTFAAEGHEPEEDAAALRAAEERRRGHFPTRLHRAADAYVVRRGRGKTVLAGYPWFTDWGRDTFIALRGLCLATGRLDDARAILLEWAGAVSDGMLPNRFPDHGEAPEFNAVDAALWYVVAVHDFLRLAGRVAERDRRTLESAVDAILSGYARGTRYGIRIDDDGLLAAGEPGLQLTWMDAKVGDWVVTPRIGKPVEVQALWLNALRIGSRLSERWADAHARGRAAFEARFWNEAAGALHDVVDVDHRAGAVDSSFRPNQIFAVGGLPFAVLDGPRARRVVDAVEARLVTPLGLRSLAPDEPDYAPRYRGGVRERDGAYHQGTVWPWLMGAFVEAWVRVRGETPDAKREARARFLAPLFSCLDDAGVGHLPEVADGDPPHAPGGCPFQAWSVGEALRLDRIVLGDV
jgi:predicted glycogen debranching enzyme